MTITSETSKFQYVGDDSTVSFAFNNAVFAAADLLVYLNNVVQTLGVDYTVSVAGDFSSATVTMTTAPVSGPPADILTICRAQPDTQLINYVEGDDFPAKTHQYALDRLTMANQEQALDLSLSPRLPRTLTTSYNNEAADPVADGVLAINSTNDGFEWRTAADLLGAVGDVTFTGSLFVPNDESVFWRNNANTAWTQQLRLTTADEFQVGNAVTSTTLLGTTIKASTFTVGVLSADAWAIEFADVAGFTGGAEFADGLNIKNNASTTACWTTFGLGTVSVDAAPGTLNQRWQQGMNADTAMGGDSGYNWELASYSDALTRNVRMTVNRATGYVDIATRLLVSEVDDSGGGSVSFVGRADVQDYDLIHNASTGLFSGGVVTQASATTVDVTAATGYVLNAGVSAEFPSVVRVVYGGDTGVSVSTIATEDHSYVGIDGAGTLTFFAGSAVNATTRRNHIMLARIDHPGGSIVSISREAPYGGDATQQALDVGEVVGQRFITGGTVTLDASDFTFEVAAGTAYAIGGNSDAQQPNRVAVALQSNVSFIPEYRDGSGGWTRAAAVTAIDPTVYDDGSGTPAAVGAGDWVNHRVTMDVVTGQVYVAYDQRTHSSEDSALAHLHQTVELNPATKGLAFLGWITVQQSAANLSAAVFSEPSLGAGGGSGGGSSTPGGANTQVQFNDSGTLGGDARFTYDKVSNTFSITGDFSHGNHLLQSASATDYDLSGLTANTTFNIKTAGPAFTFGIDVAGGAGTSTLHSGGSNYLLLDGGRVKLDALEVAAFSGATEITSYSTFAVENSAATSSNLATGGRLWLQANDTAALDNSHVMGGLDFRAAYNGTSNYHVGARMVAYSRELWSAGAAGTDVIFQCVSPTTTTLVDALLLRANEVALPDLITDLTGAGSITWNADLTLSSTRDLTLTDGDFTINDWIFKRTLATEMELWTGGAAGNFDIHTNAGVRLGGFGFTSNRINFRDAGGSNGASFLTSSSLLLIDNLNPNGSGKVHVTFGDFVASATDTAISRSDFPYIPAVNGVPSGTPNDYGAGQAATVYDYANDDLYVYNHNTNMWVGFNSSTGGITEPYNQRIVSYPTTLSDPGAIHTDGLGFYDDLTDNVGATVESGTFALCHGTVDLSGSTITVDFLNTAGMTSVTDQFRTQRAGCMWIPGLDAQAAFQGGSSVGNGGSATNGIGTSLMTSAWYQLIGLVGGAGRTSGGAFTTRGGGCFILVVEGDLNLQNATIEANGQSTATSGSSGAGGGSVIIICTGSLNQVNLTVNAKGGNGAGTGRGGGGGYVAIYAASKAGTATVSVAGGTGTVAGAAGLYQNAVATDAQLRALINACSKIN